MKFVWSILLLRCFGFRVGAVGFSRFGAAKLWPTLHSLLGFFPHPGGWWRVLLALWFNQASFHLVCRGLTWQNQFTSKNQRRESPQLLNEKKWRFKWTLEAVVVIWCSPFYKFYKALNTMRARSVACATFFIKAVVSQQAVCWGISKQWYPVREMEKIRSDTCFIAAFFVSPDAHGFVRALGNFCRLQPVGGRGWFAGSRSIWTSRRIRDLGTRPVEVLGLGGCLCYFDPCGLLWLG